MKKMLIRFMLVVLITVFLTSSAHSELLIWEPFEYPVGELAGYAPDPVKPKDPDISVGFGLEAWADWGGDDPSLVMEGNLIHPLYDIEGVGNHGVVVNGMAGNVFVEYLYDDGRDYWYSFLYQAVNMFAYGELNGLFTDSGDVPEIMIQLTGGYPAMESRYTGEWEEVDVLDPEAVQWILIKVETSGSPDTTEMVYMWVDPMPGMEPDPADADIALEYNIPAGISTYFFWWAAYGDDTPMFRFDEIKIGTEFTDVSDAPPCHLARTPIPEDNAINVDSTNAILSWQPPTCLEGDITYDVYLGTLGDPNVGDNPLVVDNQPVTSYDATDDVDYDTTYYWRVDVNTDSNSFEGLTWTFTTGPPSPTVVTQPQDATVPVGVDAQFTAVILNEPTYTWYYTDTPDGIGTEIPDSDSPILTISNVQLENEGYYYCVAVNAYGEDTTIHARLLTERLMAHWKFEDNLNDQIDSTNDGISPDPISYNTGIDGQAVVISDPNKFVMIENEIGRLKSITVSAWMKPAIIEGLQVILTAAEGTDDGVIYLRGEGNELWGQVYGSTLVGFGNITEGEWNHCVLKYDTDSEQASIYLNGELAASGGIDPSVAPILPPLSIGANNYMEDSYVNGLIDDVRIYNYPVSDLDIALLYTDFVEGGTACLGNPQFDFNEDCLVNILDFEILASNWAECNIVPDCQFSLP
jgi:hypothetical protein